MSVLAPGASGFGEREEVAVADALDDEGRGCTRTDNQSELILTSGKYSNCIN